MQTLDPVDCLYYMSTAHKADRGAHSRNSPSGAPPRMPLPGHPCPQHTKGESPLLSSLRARRSGRCQQAAHMIHIGTLSIRPTTAAEARQTYGDHQRRSTAAAQDL